MPPSLLFVHIPLHASLASQQYKPYAEHVGGVIDESEDNFFNENRTYPGLNADNPVASQGGENDSVPYNGQDRAFLDAFMQSAAGKARVHGIVSGHDHGNDVSTWSVSIIPNTFNPFSLLFCPSPLPFIRFEISGVHLET